MSSLKMLLLLTVAIMLGARLCGAGSTVEAEARNHLLTAQYNLRLAKHQQHSIRSPWVDGDVDGLGLLAEPLDWDALGTTSNTLSWEIGELFRNNMEGL